MLDRPQTWTREETDAALAHSVEQAASSANVPAAVVLRSAADLSALDNAVAAALTSQDYSILKVKMTNWTVPSDEISGEPPYIFQFAQLGHGQGQYVEHESVILVSANPSSYMQAAGINLMAPPASDPAIGDLRELSALGFGDGRRCSAQEASENRNAKHAVIYANYPESTYFAHAMANVLPRLAAVIPGARKAGYKVSVVMPDESAYSTNTKLLIEALGAEFLRSPPSTPHQSIGVGLLAPWDHLLRAKLWQEFRNALIPAGEPAPDCTSGESRSKVFASRKNGARNGRWVAGTDLLETKLQSNGFEIVDNLGEMAVRDLALKLYKTCTLAGFAGGNLLNLMFLPPGSTVIEYNPMHIYADRWQFAHSVGFHFHEEAIPASGISESDAERLATQAAQF